MDVPQQRISIINLNSAISYAIRIQIFKISLILLVFENLNVNYIHFYIEQIKVYFFTYIKYFGEYLVADITI